MTWDPQPRPSEEGSDAIAAAKAGTDQVEMIYRNVWTPFFARLSQEMDDAGLSPQLRDVMIGDLHRKFILMTESAR